MISKAIAVVIAVLTFAASAHQACAEDASAAALISGFRHNHGEGSVTTDATLNRIALAQA